jgi:ABC-2 type transport system ATP-binding protein
MTDGGVHREEDAAGSDPRRIRCGTPTPSVVRMTSLEVHDLTRTFGDRRAVDGISFTATGGLLTGFVGSNGAGKTTTMRMIMGVLAVTSGEVRFDGDPVTRADRRTFGYMPEERGLYPKQPALEQLVYLARLRGIPEQAARKEALDLLDRLGLADRAKDHVEKLSLGNQQRVQIVAALMGTPRALVLDEPFSGLDPTAVDGMVDLLREHTARGVPVLFSSHQLDLVERLCERLVILRSGQVVADGTPGALQEAGTLRHRLVVDGDAGWVRGVPGVHAVDVDGPVALVEAADDAAVQRLLAAAVERGPVRELSPVRPSLAQIYREVTA